MPSAYRVRGLPLSKWAPPLVLAEPAATHFLNGGGGGLGYAQTSPPRCLTRPPPYLSVYLVYGRVSRTNNCLRARLLPILGQTTAGSHEGSEGASGAFASPHGIWSINQSIRGGGPPPPIFFGGGPRRSSIVMLSVRHGLRELVVPTDSLPSIALSHTGPCDSSPRDT